MKKRFIIAMTAMLFLCVGVSLGVRKVRLNQSPWMDNIEALCDDENVTCFAGGPNASSCSIDVTAGPVGAACSVTCTAGYACCTYNGCFCVQ